jgi:molybdopterin molybdotransferase
VVILSGGVSMGKFDFIPKILSDLKVREVFHKVSQRPGKPLWFGIGESGQAVFGLPGNPISTLVCFRRYVLPSLYQMLGAQTEIPRKLPLSDSVSFKKNLTLFQPVSIEEDGSARPIRTNGSGDFSSLGLSKGFLELPQDKDTFQLGESYEYFPW